MFSNFLDFKHCSPRLKFKDKASESVNDPEVIGTIITNNFKVKKITKYLVRKLTVEWNY